jgi:hypothetical protein
METNTETPTTLTSQETQNIFDYAIMQLAEGKSNEDVIDMMKRRGISIADAQNLVPQLRIQIAQAKVDHANKEIRNGALWCLGGLVVSIGTYSMASGGGSYLLCWGPVIFGGIQFFRGLSSISDAKAELENAQGDTAIETESEEIKLLE